MGSVRRQDDAGAPAFGLIHGAIRGVHRLADGGAPVREADADARRELDGHPIHLHQSLQTAVQAPGQLPGVAGTADLGERDQELVPSEWVCPYRDSPASLDHCS